MNFPHYRVKPTDQQARRTPGARATPPFVLPVAAQTRITSAGALGRANPRKHGDFTMPQSRFLFLLCLVALALLPACGGNEHVLEPDYHFSLNVIETPSWFPDKEMQLEPGQQAVLDSRGKPNFMRIWWRPNGELITSRDLSGLKPEQIGEKLSNTQKSWIYTTDKIEVVFLRGGASYREQPLSEKIALVCQYGDPSHMSPPAVLDGQTHENWQWVEHGLQIEIVDGAEFSRSHFQGTGAGTYLLK
jgi:hypothetical protein